MGYKKGEFMRDVRSFFFSLSFSRLSLSCFLLFDEGESERTKIDRHFEIVIRPIPLPSIPYQHHDPLLQRVRSDYKEFASIFQHAEFTIESCSSSFKFDLEENDDSVPASSSTCTQSSSNAFYKFSDGQGGAKPYFRYWRKFASGEKRG